MCLTPQQVTRIAGLHLMVVAAVILLCGCYSIVRQTYPGPALPRNQIAVITSPFTLRAGAFPVAMVGCDGVAFAHLPDRITLLPGTHKIQFRPLGGMVHYPGGRFTTGEFAVQTVSVEAGRTYRAVGRITNFVWSVEISRNK
jgi:hypothetical protein